MTAAKVINFPKPSLLQGAILNTQKNEDGFTPLPNFICDEGYLATLSGEAIKCLVFLNRHVNGFHVDQKSMGEVLVMKITGIKDNRTIRKYMAELARFQLVKIHKENGKKNTYQLSFSERLPIKPVASDVTGLDKPANRKPVASDVPSTSNAVASHATAPVASDVPSTSSMPCHPVKEIDLKENLKDKKSIFPVDNSKTEMFSDSVKYHEDNKNQYSLRELASTYTIQTDLANQAKQIDPKLDDAKIMSELKNFAQWSVGREKTTAQGWMNYWIYRIQKLSAPKAKTSKPAKAKSKCLSDAQLNYFASELCNFGTFASLYSNVGETQKSFEARISANLRKPEYAKTYGPYLAELGFVVDLGPEL